MKINPISFKGTFRIKKQDFDQNTAEIFSIKNIRKYSPENSICRTSVTWRIKPDGDIDAYIKTMVSNKDNVPLEMKSIDDNLKIELFEAGTPFEYSTSGRPGTFKKGLFSR